MGGQGRHFAFGGVFFTLDLVEVLTKGAGLQSTTLALFAYRNAFGTSYQIGYGSAIAVVILAINLVLALALLPIWRSRR